MGGMVDMVRKICELSIHGHDVYRCVTMEGWVDVEDSDEGDRPGVLSTYLVCTVLLTDWLLHWLKCAGGWMVPQVRNPQGFVCQYVRLVTHQVQLHASLGRSKIAWFSIRYDNDWGKIGIRGFNHKICPISHPHWELWGVFCENSGEHWPHYNGTVLYGA